MDLTGVARQVDEALNGRLNGASSDNSAAQTSENWIGQVQSTLNALSGNDLSAQLSTFFTGWSNLANNPTDSGHADRSAKRREPGRLHSGLSGQLNSLQSSVAQELPQEATAANTLATDIAGLNVQIVQAEGSAAGTANALLDQRDADVAQLAKLVNVTTATQRMVR